MTKQKGLQLLFSFDREWFGLVIQPTHISQIKEESVKQKVGPPAQSGAMAKQEYVNLTTVVQRWLRECTVTLSPERGKDSNLFSWENTLLLPVLSDFTDVSDSRSGGREALFATSTVE